MNCIVVDDNILSIKAMELFIKKTDSLQLMQSFSNPIEALAFVNKNKVDVIFLDIEMPEMNGIDFVKATDHLMPQIIFTTSHNEFALEAFEYNVLDYLIKPINYPRFFKAVLKAKKAHDKRDSYLINEDSVFVKKGSTIVRVKKLDILWVEALGDYIVLNTGKDKFIVHSTMKIIEEKLPVKDYVRVHRSYIVQIDKIDSIEDNTIAFNEKLIPIGKSYRNDVLKRLNFL